VESFQQWLAEAAGDPWLLCALLFAGTFVLEEAAILGGAFLTAAGELSAPAALAALYAGMAISDWCLYYLGHLARRVRWSRRIVSERTIERGQDYLRGQLAMALLAARLVPWLLFPIFIACGFVAVGFRHFALINLAIGLVYTLAIFMTALLLGELAFEYLHRWGWLVLAIAALAAMAAHRLFARRHEKAATPGPGRPTAPPPPG